MSDEFTVAAKSTRDNIVAEHDRYERALALICTVTVEDLPGDPVEALEVAAGRLDDIKDVAWEALRGRAA